MSERLARVALGVVSGLALLGAAAIDLPEAADGRFWSDGAPYHPMAGSLAFDGDLTFEARDLARVRASHPGGPQGVFREAWSVLVDPADPQIDHSPPAALNVWAVIKNGEPGDKVDLLLMGDGYTAAEMPKWHADARRLAEMLFAVPPFKERRSDFTVWAVDTPAGDSGVSRASDEVWKRSALCAQYDAFGSSEVAHQIPLPFFSSIPLCSLVKCFFGIIIEC